MVHYGWLKDFIPKVPSFFAKTCCFVIDGFGFWVVRLR